MNVVMLDYIWLIIFILMNNLSILGKIDAIEKDYSHCTRIVKAHSIMLQTVLFYM